MYPLLPHLPDGGAATSDACSQKKFELEEGLKVLDNFLSELESSYLKATITF